MSKYLKAMGIAIAFGIIALLLMAFIEWTRPLKSEPVDFGGGTPEILCQHFGGVRTVLKHGRTQVRESYYTVAEVSCNDGSTIERNYWEIVR